MITEKNHIQDPKTGRLQGSVPGPNHPGGRKHKFQKKVLAKMARDWFDKKMKENEATKQMQHLMIEDLAYDLKVSTNLLLDYQKTSSDLRLTINEIKEYEKRILIKGGLNNAYNPRFAQFLLSANYNMKEQTFAQQSVQVEFVGENEKPEKEKKTSKKYKK